MPAHVERRRFESGVNGRGRPSRGEDRRGKFVVASESLSLVLRAN